LPPPLDLGVKVLIYRHPKEPEVKSSASPLPLLSPDVSVKEWTVEAAADAATGLSAGTWLVFPGEGAVDASAVEWASVSQLVLIDSRWTHARAMASAPGLLELPRVRLGGAVAAHAPSADGDATAAGASAVGTDTLAGEAARSAALGGGGGAVGHAVSSAAADPDDGAASAAASSAPAGAVGPGGPACSAAVGRASRFWRTATEKLDGEVGLLSTAECVHQVGRCSATCF
jgi:hypothetical protein